VEDVTYRVRGVDQKKVLSSAPTHTNIKWCSIRSLSSYQSKDIHPPSVLDNLELRVCELERTTQLTKHELHNTVWPLLSEIASTTTQLYNITANSKGSRRNNSTYMQRELLERAKLCSRIIEVCLKEVEARRSFLWEWLQNNLDDANDNISTKFSPSIYWNETPHPTKEMYTLVFSSLKHVIESFKSYSFKSIDAMELMESCAHQSSSLLTLMEEEYSSDAAFVNAYNSNIQKGRYNSLIVGATLPDVINYTEVITMWGQCIDGSALRLLPEEQRRNSYRRSNNKDGAFQKRLQLEATAMKSMMELLESMEEDLYNTFYDEDHVNNVAVQRKRPPPDRFCYNIILASMARQINPSLYEMRLVLQRMMERVKYEMEHSNGNEDHNEFAMSFFPDVFSYNALIEARANRSAMFASDRQKKKHQQVQSKQQFTTALSNFKHRPSPWQQGQSSNLQQRKRRFTSSEEEALLAEQILEEMSHLATVSVPPNVWSYNSLIKAWIKTDSERGLRRAVLLLRALAWNGRDINRTGEHEQSTPNSKALAAENEDEKNTVVLSVFDRIASWGKSLLSKGDSAAVKEDQRSLSSETNRSESDEQVRRQHRSSKDMHRRQNQPQQVMTGIGNRLQYLQQSATREESNNRRSHKKSANSRKQSQPMNPVNIGMASRMALMNSASAAHEDRESKVVEEDDAKLDQQPIGPLPIIETSVTPDLKTFHLVLRALERRSSTASAQLASELLLLLEECYFDLKPGVNIYNSALRVFVQAGKKSSNVHSCLTSAQHADELLCKLLDKDREETGMFPPPDETSFLLVINAWSNAALAAISTSNTSDAQIAGQHADAILKKLQLKQMKSTNVTLACYGAVIRTWASLGRPEKAQLILEEMIANSEHLPLDLIHFNAVFEAWANKFTSHRDLKGDEIVSRLLSIRELLLEMNSKGDHQSCYNVDADTSSFNQVIRACYAPWQSTSKVLNDELTRHEALDIVYDCYIAMSQDYNSPHRPDAHTYGHLFKAISCLLPSTNINPETNAHKYKLCSTILHDCCEEGYLTKSALWTLCNMFTDDVFAKLLLSELGHRGVNMSKEKFISIPENRLLHFLPKEWSRKGSKYQSLNSHRQ